MPSQGSILFRNIFAELNKHGFLLLSDSKLPSLTTLVTGESIRGSWWGHPKGRAIFRVAGQIADHPDVAVTKLISSKVTFVHRKLWPTLLAIASAREQWQMKGLSRKARHLLQIVDQNGEVRTDRLPFSSTTKRSPWAKAARELEERLLVYAEQFHSETGAHAKRMESWEHWRKRIGLSLERIDSKLAMHQLEELIYDLNERYKARARLPWVELKG